MLAGFSGSYFITQQMDRQRKPIVEAVAPASAS
jgi:hypothetical protein